MGVSFDQSAKAEIKSQNATALTTQDASMTIEELSLVQERETRSQDPDYLAEVDSISSQINAFEINTILDFGKSVASDLSKASRMALDDADQFQRDSKFIGLMGTLNSIMNKIDISELNKQTGLIGKIFGSIKDQLEKIISKYHTMGDEIDKIYIELKHFEVDAKKSNQILAKMKLGYIDQYHLLGKYIDAGKQASKDIQEFIKKRENDLSETNDESIRFEIDTLNEAYETLDKVVMDLECGEKLSLAELPTLHMQQKSNIDLIRTIDQAFMIGLPTLEQQIAQAILVKRQALQAESLAALKAKTNQLIKSNAKNITEQSIKAQRLATGSFVEATTIQETYKTIIDGIEQSKKIQQEAQKKREADRKVLDELKTDFFKRFGEPIKNN